MEKLNIFISKEVCKNLEYESLRKEFSTSIAATAAKSNKIPGADLNWKNFLIISIGIFFIEFVVINSVHKSVKSSDYIFRFPKFFILVKSQ